MPATPPPTTQPTAPDGPATIPPARPAPAQVAVELADTLGARLTALPGQDPNRDLTYNNPHYRAASGARRLFVKVIAEEHFYTAETTAAQLLATVPIATTVLLDHGALSTGGHWIAYEWADLSPCDPTPKTLHRAGQVLGLLHHHTRGIHHPGLPRYASAASLATRKIDAVARFDPELACQLRALHTRLADQLDPRDDDPVGLLHGDYGWRNLTQQAGRLCVVDFERAAIGPASLDFAKLLDRELDTPEDLAAFKAGYTQYATWPSAAAQNMTRLKAVAAITGYARSRGDLAFGQHGLKILRRLQDLMPAGLGSGPR